MTKKLTIIILFVFAINILKAEKNSMYVKKEYKNKEGAVLPYRMLYPKNYDKNKKYPLVLFLHGAGERGSDNEKQLTHGSSLFLRKEIRKKYPAIVIMPQCPQDDYWAKVDVSMNDDGSKNFDFTDKDEITQPLQLVLELVESVIKKESVDTNKLYITGLSMGGFGTFELLAHCPEMFAAAAPICGGGNLKKANKYAKNVNLWIFHGAKDDVVSVEHSRNIYKQLKIHNAEVKYTEYPEAYHDSWELVFDEKDFIPWMFSNVK